MKARVNWTQERSKQGYLRECRHASACASAWWSIPTPDSVENWGSKAAMVEQPKLVRQVLKTVLALA